MVKDNTFRDRVGRYGDLDTLRGTANFLGVSPMTVKAWVDGGQLPSITFGNVVVVNTVDAAKVYSEMIARREALKTA